MGKFILTTQRNGECEVCGDVSGKCRRIEELHLCMTFADAKLGEVQNGYKCVKRDEGKGWASFKLDDTQEWTEQQRQQWKDKAQQRRSEQAALDADKKARSLAAVERDRAYQKLLAELTLHPEDHADLIRRGLTNEQIELGEFRSVERYQQLQGQYPDLLPGIHPSGRSLINTNAGYVCFVRDKDGLRVAAQLRLRVLADGDTNRYRWQSGQKSKGILHLFPDKSDPAGELPLAVRRPQSTLKPIGIGLAEGTGVKPLVASDLLKLIMIGAAGGQFTSSPATLRQTLEQFAAELKTQDVMLFPDAGDVRNDCVMLRWEAVITLLESWGFTVQIGWWGQVAKTDSDIDELKATQLEEIRYISPADFMAIAREHGGLKSTRHRKVQPPAAKLTEIQALQAATDERHYQALSKLTAPAWKEINTPKLDLESMQLERGCVYIISSAKGTSKTESLIPILPQIDNSYAWFSRIALGREECHRLGLVWREDMKSYNGKLKVGFCSNSAHQFNPRQLQNNGLLLVDECDQVFDHNFSSTCNREGSRPLILAALKAHLAAAIAGGGMALFMSADITDRDVEYIRSIAPPDAPVRLIVNHYKPPRGIVQLDESDKPDALIDDLIRQLEAGQPCFVIDDIKDGVRGCKSIAELILRLHPDWADRIVQIHSETSCTEAVMTYIKNINSASQSTLLLCCSPSVVSGISITNGRFNENVYLFLNGVLVCSQGSQALARIRGARHLKVWAAEQGLIFAANRSTDPAEIKRWYHDNYKANSKHLLGFQTDYNPLTTEWDSPHFDLFCKNAAYRNTCMLDLRQRFKALLIEEGYQVETTNLGANQAIEAGLKAAWYDLELAKAMQLDAAELLSDSELSARLNAATRPTPQEQLEIDKTLMLKKFGQALIDRTTYEHKSGVVLTGFAAMHLKNHLGRYGRALEAFYLLQADPREAALKDLAPEERQLRTSGERFAGDTRHYSRQREARQFLQLPQFIKPHQWFAPHDLVELADRARQTAETVKDAIGFNPAKCSNGQIFVELMLQIGLDFDTQVITPAGGGRRYRERCINQESFELAQLYVAHRESMQHQAVAAIEPVPAVEAVPTLQPVPAVAPPAAIASPVEAALSAPEMASSDHPPDLLSSQASRGGDQQMEAECTVSATVSYVSAIEAVLLPSSVEVAALTVIECPVSAIEVQAPVNPLEAPQISIQGDLAPAIAPLLTVTTSVAIEPAVAAATGDLPEQYLQATAEYTIEAIEFGAQAIQDVFAEWQADFATSVVGWMRNHAREALDRIRQLCPQLVVAT